MTAETTTAALTRTALSAEDAIEHSEKFGVGPVEYARTKRGVDPAEYDTARELREALYPDRTAELAATGPSAAARGAAMLAKLTAGKSVDQAHREVNGRTGHSHARAHLSADGEAESEAESEAEADGVAGGALFSQDAVQVARTEHTPASYVRRVYGVDPAEYDTETSLRAALSEVPTRDADRQRAQIREEVREARNAALRAQNEARLAAQEADTSAEELARRAAGQVTPVHYRVKQTQKEPIAVIRDRFGIDPDEYDTEDELVEALRASVDEHHRS